MNIRDILDMYGLKEIDINNSRYEEIRDIIQKMRSTTDLSKLSEYSNRLANISLMPESDLQTEKAKQNNTENNCDKKDNEKCAVNNAETAVYKTNKATTYYDSYESFMVDKTLIASFDNKNSAWDIKFVTPGATKDDVLVSYDANTNTLCVNVTNDYRNRSYQKDFHVPACLNKRIKNIKWRVLNGITEVMIFVEEKSEFSIDYID